ncbi:MAG: hypothetical protein QNJ74_18610 [Trichodesmium sp. MO_231.B1]|nr:hypothetical protein [Trichodesmium sp. MO_231.B1]
MRQHPRHPTLGEAPLFPFVPNGTQICRRATEVRSYAAAKPLLSLHEWRSLR